jgi:hypothetical protein
MERRKRRSKKRELTDEQRNRVLAAGRTTFDKYGVNNYERAHYARLIGQEVLASRNPAFLSLQPKIKAPNLPAWIRAYQIVHSFLNENAAQQTLQVMKPEARTSRGWKLATGQTPGFEANTEDFDKLMRHLPNSVKSTLKSRVDRYAMLSEYADEVHNLDLAEVLKVAPLEPDFDFNGQRVLTSDGERVKPWDEEEAIDELGADSESAGTLDLSLD